MNIEYARISKEIGSRKYDPIAQLALLPLRIVASVNGCDRTNTKAIRNDFSELVKVISKIGNTCAGKDMYSPAVGLISLIDPSARGLLLRQLDFAMRLRIKNSALDVTILTLVDSVVQWYAQNGYIDACGDLIFNLIQKSENENCDNIMRHRSLTTASLSILVDLDREKTIAICELQEQYFKRSSSVQAAQFYWYYAFSLYVTGKPDMAKPMLQKCSELYTDSEGTHSWIGALAMVFYHYIGLESADSEGSEQYLWNFLRKMDTGVFDSQGSQADEIRIHTRYVLLRRHMEKQSLRSFLPEINRYRKECEVHQYKTTNPRLTVRTAENLLCAYYFEVGDYLNAVHHALQSLETKSPNNLANVPAKDLLYATLLQLYNAMNDGQQMAKYTELLSSALVAAEIDEEYYRKRLLVHTSQIKLGLPMDSTIEEYRKDIDSRYRLLVAGNTNELDKWGVSIAYWYVAMLSLANDRRRMDRGELSHCEQLLRYFLNNPTKFPFNNIQLAFVYLELARLEWAQKKENAVSTMQKSLRYCRSSVISKDVKVTILRVAAELFYEYKQLPETSKFLRDASVEMMDGITKAWQSATSYLNDHRLSQVLASVQSEFDRCYALLRDQTPKELRYTYILRFKNLAALVGRERNQILRSVVVDEALKDNIHQLQNQLAATEFDDARQGTSRAASMQDTLLHLEAEFSKKFPEILRYREIDYNKVSCALADGEAIVEYYFAQHPDLEDAAGVPALDVEIFVCTNANGNRHIHQILIENGHEILAETNDFIQILQNSRAAAVRSGDKSVLRAELYRHLLAPVVPFLKGIKTIYIAPDRELFNLPFEILYADNSGLLQDHFCVCRIVSGRDILYFDNHPIFNDGCLLLGDPAYGAEDASPSEDHRDNTNAPTVHELPFSGIEVDRISKYFNSPCCTRENATKFALKNTGPCRVIHLATHGSFDQDMESNALYSSCLLFAGYNNWISNMGSRDEFGNGILSADEISRLDLRGTELVVLSACLSGMGDVSYGTMQGLLSAFSAAGVHWVVSHMWKANDFTTGILMDSFYDAYLNKGFSVPDALQHAKNYLSTVTVGELRQKGWFSPPPHSRLSPEEITYLDRCNKSIDRRKPFQDEGYWGGFVVYRCQ